MVTHLKPLKSEPDSHFRLFKLLGQPVNIVGKVSEVTPNGDYVVSEHLRMIEKLMMQGSEFEWRLDPTFPVSKPIRISSASIAYDRELNEKDDSDTEILRQYTDQLTRLKAQAIGLKV